MSIHNSLPPIDDLRRICQSIAMLDAIYCPEWMYRYYSFNNRWGPGSQMASMRNGSGDEYFILFTKAGAAIKGFAHEYPAWNWEGHSRPLPGMFDGIPNDFDGFMREPAFSINETTYCYWRKYEDARWQCGSVVYPPGKDPAGAIKMLAILLGNPDTYMDFVKEYYLDGDDSPERHVDAQTIRRVYRHEPLTNIMVRNLHGGATLESVAADVEEIGYPHVSSC